MVNEEEAYYVRKVFELCVREGKGSHVLAEYLNKNGFTYLQGNLVARLAQMKVNEHARFNFLTSKKKEFYKNYPIEKLTDKEIYYLNLKLVDQLAKVDNVEEFIKAQI